MKNTFGTNLTVTLFGESHGEAVGAVLDGMAPGIRIDREHIEKRLKMRRPYGRISTARQEKDDFKIISGVYNGLTTGSPLTVIIENKDIKSKDYSELRHTPRPGHADLTASIKYSGFEDPRGGGHFSGRLTAALVAVGAICESALLSKGIRIGTHIKRLSGIEDRELTDLDADIAALSDLLFPTLDPNASDRMMARIESAQEDGDSVGGILESAVTGMPAGVGEPWFDSVESILSHALFSIPGIKGVEFGKGFAIADMLGSEANDPFIIENGRICTKTNNNGGINGGITNGMPIIFRCAVKPTPSIFKEQDTVNTELLEPTRLKLSGRHDPAIIHRARAVVDAVTAFTLLDLLQTKYGCDWIR